MSATPADVVLRDVWDGRVWRANVFRLVEERADVTALWAPRGIHRWIPVDAAGREIRIPQAEWTLAPRTTAEESLTLVRPRAAHSLWLMWDAHGRFSHWYVNFEEPLGRSPLGFDYRDWKLDLIVSADGTMRWKDEDELEEAHRRGLLDAGAVRAEAERVLADPPWPTGWEAWRPDPVWPAPSFPSGWDLPPA